MTATPVVTDFGQFTRLRSAARAEDPEALKAAARQFEALFTQQLLKSMRAANLGEDILGGEQTGVYRDLYDQQLATHISAGKGLGIAEVLIGQLQRQSPAAPAAAAPAPAPAKLTDADHLGATADKPVIPLQMTRSENLSRGLASTLVATPLEAPTHGVATAAYVDDGLDPAPQPLTLDAAPIEAPRFGVATAAYADDLAGPGPTPIALKQASATRSESSPSRRTFAEQLMPHAERAAQELGVSPRTLLAQAALETGWGRKMIRTSDGQSSLNFFGLKADKGWQGARANSATHEYVNGLKTHTTAQFRAYDSIAEAFDDYVRFVRDNPRYRAALAHQGSDARYAQALQQAGYATDPHYAAKIVRVSSSSAMLAATRAAHLSL